MKYFGGVLILAGIFVYASYVIAKTPLVIVHYHVDKKDLKSPTEKGKCQTAN